MGDKIFLLIGTRAVLRINPSITIPLVILDASTREEAIRALPEGYNELSQTIVTDPYGQDLELVETTVIRA